MGKTRHFQIRISSLNSTTMCPRQSMSVSDFLTHRSIPIAALQELASMLDDEQSINGILYRRGPLPTPDPPYEERPPGPVGFAIAESLIQEVGKPPTVDFVTPYIGVLRWPELGIIIVNVYAPRLGKNLRPLPDGSSPRAAFWALVENTVVTCSLENHRTLIIGDLNCHLLPQFLVLDPTLFDENAALVVPMLKRLNYSITNNKFGHVDMPTFKGAGPIPPSTVDYILCPNDVLKAVSSFKVEGTRQLHKYTAHNLLHATLNIKKEWSTTYTAPEKPHFTGPSAATTVDIHYGKFMMEALALQHVQPPRKPPSHDQFFESERTKELKILHADCKMRKQDISRTGPLLEQSVRADADAAMLTYALEILHLFENDQVTAYKALKQGLRRRHIVMDHIKQASKDLMLAYYMDLLGVEERLEALDLSFENRPLHPILRKPLDGSPRLHVWTDGSFTALPTDAPGPAIAGWAVVVDGPQTFHLCGSIDILTTTPGEFNCALAEAVAIMESLRAYNNRNITFHVDSTATIFMGEKLDLLEASNFVDLTFAHVWHHIALLARDRDIKFEHVPSHTGVELNEQADLLSKYGSTLGRGKAVIITCPPMFGKAMAHMAPHQSNAIIRQWKQTHTYKTLYPIRHPPPFYPLAAAQTPPTEKHIDQALTRLSDVTAGNDRILQATCKDPELRAQLVSLISAIWKTQTVPVDWTRTIMAQLKKAQGPLTPQNSRGISLRSIPSRILTHILLRRVPSPDMLDNQCAYKRSKGCLHAVHVVRQVMATAKASGKTLVLTMIDLKHAFDTVNRMQLEKVLRIYGYDEVSITLIKQLWNDEVILKFADGTFSAPFSTKRSVAQGDVLSSFVFSLCCDVVASMNSKDMKQRTPRDFLTLSKFSSTLMTSSSVRHRRMMPHTILRFLLRHFDNLDLTSTSRRRRSWSLMPITHLPRTLDLAMRRGVAKGATTWRCTRLPNALSPCAP